MPVESERTMLQQFHELAQRLYTSHNRRLIPKHPWILVRVLPKEQRRGSIYLPETQNKVLLEGIVLETWPQWEKAIHTVTPENGHFVKSQKLVVMKSLVQRGDHIVFPHFEGLPVPYLNEEEKDAYRVVREHNPADVRCEVVGKLEYEQGTLQQQLLDEMPEELLPVSRQIINFLLQRFHVVRKQGEMRTVSGQ